MDPDNGTLKGWGFSLSPSGEVFQGPAGQRGHRTFCLFLHEWGQRPITPKVVFPGYIGDRGVGLNCLELLPSPTKQLPEPTGGKPWTTELPKRAAGVHIPLEVEPPLIYSSSLKTEQPWFH